MQYIYLTYKFLICLILSEKKIFSDRINYFIGFFSSINIIKYIFYLFNKDINPIKSKEFRKFIILNKKKWKEIKKNIKFNDSKEEILIETFINHPEYSLGQALIAKHLQFYYGSQCIGLLRKGDIKGEILFRSFGIDKYYYYKPWSFLKRCKYIYKSILILKNIKNINAFCKIRIKKIDIGLLSYDSFMRYTRNPTAKEVNFKLILFFAEALFASDFFEKIFQNKNITKLVQCETQFVPLSILFQKSLLKKNKIYSRSGSHLNTIRVYSKFDQRYKARESFSKKLFNTVYKYYKTKSIKLINKYHKKKLQVKNKFFLDAYYADKWTKTFDEDLISISKSDLCKMFNWDIKKKIGTIFLHTLIDGNYWHGWRHTFLDNYTWLHYTLETIKKLKNINWIIKEHPHEFYYNTKVDWSSLINDIEKKYTHIRCYPEKLHPAFLLKFTDVAITSHGTVGVEYPSFGIPSIVAERSSYTNFGFTLEPKNKIEYQNLLKSVHQINKLNKQKTEKAKVYLFIRNILLKNNLSIISSFDSSRKIDVNNFWYQSKQNLKKYNFNNDHFTRMFKSQLQLKLRHTVNFDLCSIRNKILNDN